MSSSNFKLGFFTEDAYYSLLHDIHKNSEYYYRDEEWLPTYFSSQEGYFGMSTVEISKFTPKYTAGKKDDPQKTKEDLENTKLLHDAFKNLTPLQATNKYMWTYLCHAVPEYSAYIRDRWMQEKKEDNIKNRFFVTNDKRILLNYNGLSRLWWYGHLTYDKESNNHYALTEVLLTNQTICKDVMDTLNCTNYNRMRGVLLAIKDFNDELSDNEGITDYFRECKKYLNNYAAVTILESLESDEIRDIAYNYMMKLREKKNK